MDVNVLIALMDETHAFHSRAHEWWSAHASSGWASCPLTENGAVRVMANPSYSPSRQFTVEEVVQALARFVGATDHHFWPDQLSLRDRKAFHAGRIHGSRMLTDLYLLAVAAQHGGRLVTFNRGIPIGAVVGAKSDNLCVL